MMATVLRHRDFRRLWVARTTDALGSWLLVMAVPLQVFTLTGSAMSTALALVVESVPALAIGPWAGVLIDRRHRKTILLAASLTAAAAVTMMLSATTPARVGYLFLGLFAENVAVCFLRPALRAVTPMVVSNESDLAAANSLSSFSDSVLRLTGPLAGTFLVAHGWFNAVVIIDAASYVVAALVVAGIAIPSTVRTVDAGSRLRDGLRHVLVTPLLRGLLVPGWFYWTGNAALTALLVPFVATRLHASGQTLGYLIAGLGLGYVAGSALSTRLMLRYTTRSILTTAYTSVGLCFLVMVNAPALPIAVTAATAAGVPGVVASIAVTYRLQLVTPNPLLGRVSATFFTSDALAAVTGALLATAVVEMTNLGAALNIFAVVVALTGVMTAALLTPADRGRRRGRRSSRGVSPPTRNWWPPRSPDWPRPTRSPSPR